MEKGKIQTFRDLEAWKHAHTLATDVYRITKQFPKEEMFGIVNQMRRAAVSIPSNIAEGFSRQSPKEKVQFYSIAQGSLTELQSQLLISRDIGYLNDKEFSRIDTQSMTTHKIINGLIKSSRKFFNSYA